MKLPHILRPSHWFTDLNMSWWFFQFCISAVINRPIAVVMLFWTLFLLPELNPTDLRALGYVRKKKSVIQTSKKLSFPLFHTTFLSPSHFFILRLPDQYSVTYWSFQPPLALYCFLFLSFFSSLSYQAGQGFISPSSVVFTYHIDCYSSIAATHRSLTLREEKFTCSLSGGREGGAQRAGNTLRKSWLISKMPSRT